MLDVSIMHTINAYISTRRYATVMVLLILFMVLMIPLITDFNQEKEEILPVTSKYPKPATLLIQDDNEDSSEKEDASSTSSVKSNVCDSYLLTTEVGGQSGNQMSEYVAFFGQAKRLNITPVLPLDMMWMRPVFPNLSPKTLEELGCDPDIKFKFTKRNELWNSNNVEDLQKHYGNEKHFTIQKYSNDFKLLAQYSDELKHEFEFNSTYQKQSKEFLIKVKHKHLTKLRVKEKDLRSLNFIGVHVRRTDYGAHIQKTFGGQLISEKYFYTAMNRYRDRFGLSLKNVLVFVVASDDLEWCRNTFKNMTDVYYVDKDNSGFLDMAIMSKCNHSIIDLGTFGLWGSFLAGGQTIWARDYSKKPRYNPPEIMTYFPQWTFISERVHKWYK